ncbi:MAG: tRNA (N6-threonylcarbamoyladenosine(37)-N6)-methyltransferase TrmO [Rhodospirillales bacterium RIFCSPLOWO2_12_FULL_58_28]|nr:MAG: tRNA (N6-threonylcarbamoyladenosine(37)-N6)-methyltransferase TrmO [Rhodospirillales bacterium RIFCSPLOWO2_02_FULL_58_16]OHC77274.1 MAG: tRNA (N6-threonylcarbamoyladenosine(37)-N6)-methyltransferase TrmO [Rhodospirillales bacterium RIFCSPLOWO2_12_FULL_58_28]
MEIKIKPIGFAGNQEKKHFGGWNAVITDLVIDEKYQEALDGLGDYSHLIVIFWLHEVKTCKLRLVPQGKIDDVPEVGIFACRCPGRPNPIGISTVNILSIKDNVITVKGLDVINGTPVIDIKPYTPQYDAVAEAIVPEWVAELDY